MESVPDPSVKEHSQFIEDGKITDGQAFQLDEQELQWRKDSHIAQSEIKDDVTLEDKRVLKQQVDKLVEEGKLNEEQVKKIEEDGILNMEK